MDISCVIDRDLIRDFGPLLLAILTIAVNILIVRFQIRKNNEKIDEKIKLEGRKESLNLLIKNTSELSSLLIINKELIRRCEEEGTTEQKQLECFRVFQKLVSKIFAIILTLDDKKEEQDKLISTMQEFVNKLNHLNLFENEGFIEEVAKIMSSVDEVIKKERQIIYG